MFFAHVLLKFMCVIEFFLAFIAGEFVPWVVQMYKTNVFLETMLFTKNLITIYFRPSWIRWMCFFRFDDSVEVYLQIHRQVLISNILKYIEIRHLGAVHVEVHVDLFFPRAQGEHNREVQVHILVVG